MRARWCASQLARPVGAHLRAERKSGQTVKSYGDGVRTYLTSCAAAGQAGRSRIPSPGRLLFAAAPELVRSSLQVADLSLRTDPPTAISRRARARHSSGCRRLQPVGHAAALHQGSAVRSSGRGSFATHLGS